MCAAGTIAARRLLAAAVVVVSGTSCSSSAEDDLRTFDLVPAEGGIDAVPHPEPESPRGLRSVDAVVLDAPHIVSAGEDFEVLIELRNRLMEEIEFAPCPWFHASFGESGTVSAAHGEMPCESIGSLRAGERIRLRLEMTAPSPATAGEGGEWAGFGWQVGTALQANITIPMEHT